MTKNQISSILNSAIKNNMLPSADGTWVQLNEDLTNFADFGETVGNASIQSVENLKRNLFVSIKNEVIARVLESKTFGMVKDNAKFRATVQRIMCSDLYCTQDSNRSDLSWNNGQTWHDGKYYGTDIDAKLYTKTDAFKIVNSVTDAEWEQALSSADELSALMNLISINVENTITSYLNSLVKRLYIEMIRECNGATVPRKVDLLTEFNAKHCSRVDASDTPIPYTMSEICSDRDLLTMFNDFVKSVASKLTTYVQEYNRKYNDGTIAQFTPKDKVEIVMLSDFASDIEYMSNPIEYNIAEMPRYKTIASWQTTTDKILPSLSDVSTIKVDNETISNVVGIIYDTDGVGITTIDGGKHTTVEYVGSQGFTNYHHHIENRYFVDTRLASVILTLD